MFSLIRKHYHYLLFLLPGLNGRGVPPCLGSGAAPAPSARGFSGDRSGVVVVLVALAMPVLLGLTAFAVDVSQWSGRKNSIQAAADNSVLSAVMSAAQAGATSAQIKNQAFAVAAATGFTNGQNGVTVTVNNPPASGANTSNTSAYEVIINQPQTRYFAVLLGAAPTVSGRAVALVAGNPACVLALAPSGIGVSLANAASIGATKCAVAANSSSGSAVSLVNASTLTAANLNVVGNYSAVNGSTVVTPPTIIKTGAPATADPYASLAVPSFTTSGCQAAVSVVNGNTKTISAGCYDGINVANSAHLTMTAGNYVINGGSPPGISVANGSTLTMGAGIYTINGGSFSLGNATTATGSGVSIVLTNTPSSPNTSNWGKVDIVNGSSITLTPPTSGAFQGVAFYMDRNAPATITDSFVNASSTSITGSLYFPSQPVTYANGSSTGTACLQLIALTVSFANAASFGTSCGSLDVPGLRPVYGANGKGVPAE